MLCPTRLLILFVCFFINPCIFIKPPSEFFGGATCLAGGGALAAGGSVAECSDPEGPEGLASGPPCNPLSPAKDTGRREDTSQGETRKGCDAGRRGGEEASLVMAVDKSIMKRLFLTRVISRLRAISSISALLHCPRRTVVCRRPTAVRTTATSTCRGLLLS